MTGANQKRPQTIVLEQLAAINRDSSSQRKKYSTYGFFRPDGEDFHPNHLRRSPVPALAALSARAGGTNAACKAVLAGEYVLVEFHLFLDKKNERVLSGPRPTAVRRIHVQPPRGEDGLGDDSDSEHGDPPPGDIDPLRYGSL